MLIDKKAIDRFSVCAKGISMFTIVLFHLVSNYCVWLPSTLRSASLIGGHGIFVFFLLSGYGLTCSKTEKGMNGFWKKRLLKVYIPYMVVILISFLIPVCEINGNRVIALLSHALFFKAFSDRYIGTFGGQFWYISTIFELYLLFYIILKVFEKKQIKTNDKLLLTVSFGSSIVWMTLTGLISKSSKALYSVFLTFIWAFSLGSYFAHKMSGGGVNTSVL